jgi:hypothetical protein
MLSKEEEWTNKQDDSLERRGKNRGFKKALCLSFFVYPSHTLVLKSSVSPLFSTVCSCAIEHSTDCSASTVGSPSLFIPEPAPDPPGFFPSLTSTPGIGSLRSPPAVFCSVLGTACCPP